MVIRKKSSDVISINNNNKDIMSGNTQVVNNPFASLMNEENNGSNIKGNLNSTTNNVFENNARLSYQINFTKGMETGVYICEENNGDCIEYENGDCYEGPLNKSKRHGNGCYTHSGFNDNNTFYEGDFENDKIKKGILTISEERNYEVTFDEEKKLIKLLLKMGSILI